MPTRPLPANPDLGQLRNQARDLQRAARAGEPEATALVRELHPRLADAPAERLADLTLADAQLTVARRHRLPSWPALVRHIETVDRFSRSPHAVAPTGDPADELVRLAVLTYGDDDPERVRQGLRLLAERPELAGATIHTAVAAGDVDAARSLLAADPGVVRREGGPYGFVPLVTLAYSRLGTGDPLAVARLLLDAGADPDAGYLWEGLPSPFTALTGAFGGGEGAQPRHPSGLRLARSLLDAGADANDSQALYNLGLDYVGDDPAHLELLFAHGLGEGDGGPWHRRMGAAHPAPHELVEDELLTAAGHGWPRRAAVVLAHPVDVNGLGTRHPVRRGLTAWALAQRGGHTGVLDLLAEAGGRPAEADPVLDLIGVVMRGDGAAARRAAPALVAEARRRYPDQVVEAARLGRAEGAMLLLDLGWDVNARAARAHHPTALHEAAWRGDLDLIRMLVGRGADPALEDSSFHSTPQGWAEHNGQAETAALLADL